MAATTMAARTMRRYEVFLKTKNLTKYAATKAAIRYVILFSFEKIQFILVYREKLKAYK